MPSLTFRAGLTAAAVFVAAITIDVRVTTQAPPSGQIDPALYSGMKWRSIGPRSRRPVDRRRRQREAAERVLLRRGRRRRVEVGRLRPHLGAGQRRVLQELFRRRARRRALEPRRRLRRNGRVLLPRKHHPGGWHLQDHRRRQDLDSRRARQHARPSARFASIRAIRTSRGRRSSATRMDRTTSAASSRRRMAARPGRRRSSKTPRRAPSTSSSTRRTLTSFTPALWEIYRTPHSMESGGPGSGLYKSTDGGLNVDRHHEEPRAALGTLGKSRHLRVRRRQQSRLRDRRERKRRRVHLGRCRRDVEGGDNDRKLRQRAFYYTHIVRRHDGQGPRLRPQRPVLAQRRRRQDVPDADPRRRTATTTTCGSRRTTTSG